jgi:hypothetical protein
MPRRNISSGLRAHLISVDTQLQKELRAVVEDTSTDLKAYFEKVTKDWTHKVKFRRKMKVSAVLIEGTVQAVGQHRKIWLYVDQGTKAHIIRAKNGRALAFQLNYDPRTRPGAGNTPPQSGGAGKSSGDRVFAKVVRHPGTKARQFAKSFEASLAPSFQYRVEAAIRRASRRA